jgi:hypothetical protein
MWLQKTRMVLDVIIGRIDFKKHLHATDGLKLASSLDDGKQKLWQ